MPMTQDNKITPAGQACIALLEQVLDDAKAGKVTSVGVICCGPSDFGAAHAGPDAAKLNLGIDTLKRTILNIVSPELPAPSPIKRPSILHRA